MKIAIYGATGMIGSRVAAEALKRGHEVTGITRSGGDLPPARTAVQGDAGDAALAKRVAAEADVVVSAIGPSRTGGDRREYLAELRTLVETLGGARLLVVGGAGSLLVDGKRLIDDPALPRDLPGRGAHRGRGPGVPARTRRRGRLDVHLPGPGDRSPASAPAPTSSPPTPRRASRSPPRTTRSRCSTRSRTPGTVASGSP